MGEIFFNNLAVIMSKIHEKNPNFVNFIGFFAFNFKLNCTRFFLQIYILKLPREDPLQSLQQLLVNRLIQLEQKLQLNKQQLG